jgi:hypothetical protein
LCCVHDTIAFEQRGISATVILTQAFVNTAVFQFQAKGMAGHPYVVLPHPISNLPREAMREVTQRCVAQVVRQLTA